MVSVRKRFAPRAAPAAQPGEDHLPGLAQSRECKWAVHPPVDAQQQVQATRRPPGQPLTGEIGAREPEVADVAAAHDGARRARVQPGREPRGAIPSATPGTVGGAA